MPHRSPTPSPTWTIQPVPRQSIPQVLTFINQARSTLFPNRPLKPDTPALFTNGAYFLEARQNHHLIATIGYLPYDHRFPQFAFHDAKTAEVVRLFVDPCHRRGGVALALFKRLYEVAWARGFRRFYLHTHPWLLGAGAFWAKTGFEVLERERETVWETVHMQMRISGGKGGVGTLIWDCEEGGLGCGRSAVIR